MACAGSASSSRPGSAEVEVGFTGRCRPAPGRRGSGRLRRRPCLSRCPGGVLPASTPSSMPCSTSRSGWIADAMRRQVAACLDAGVDGIVVLGLATEVAKLSERERLDVIAWAAEDVAGRRAAGRDRLRQLHPIAAAAAGRAEAAGADWLVLQPPSVGSYDGSELLRGLRPACRCRVRAGGDPERAGADGARPDAEGIATLTAAHPNITHLKGEMPVVQLRRVIEACGDRLLVLNGQAGLEMIDFAARGCQGFVLAPDMVDHATRIWRLWHGETTSGAEAAYALLLPEIVFVMRSLEHLIAYGKRIFALRAGLAAHDRAPREPVTPFGSASMRSAPCCGAAGPSAASHADGRAAAGGLPDPIGPGRGGARRLAHRRAREAGHRRRERLGQVDARPRHHAACCRRRPRSPPTGSSSRASTCCGPPARNGATCAAVASA